MASQWRIRHKLMLGLVLVTGTIALILGGTLYGIFSYRTIIIDTKVSLEEYRAAERFNECVAGINRPAIDRDGSLDAIKDDLITKRVKLCQVKLDEYEEQLTKNASHGCDATNIDHRREQVRKIRIGFDKLNALEKDYLGKVHLVNDNGDRKPVDDCIAELGIMASDLQDAIYGAELAPLDKVSRDTYQMAMKIVIPASVIGVFSIVGLMRVFRWIFIPVRDLEVGVKQLAKGDFDHRIEIHSGDEMEDLAAAFNDMSCRLHDLYGDLARQVNERSRQLVRSERLASVGFLAAGVAHEINNPLASIAFCSEALEGRLGDLLRLARAGSRRSDDEEVFVRYLKMIQEEAFRCKKITEKLLEFSRSSERRREPTDLAGLVKSVIDITQHLQSCKGKEIVFESVPERAAGGRITAPVNAEEIKSVVLNLVVNALDSMEEGGKLTIHLGLHDGMAEMYFTDTGCGMSQEVLENIFEPFFTRSRTGKGTGLGLTISHRIINQHGGEIEATSDGTNKGSTFIVRLPLVESEPRQAQTTGSAEPARRAA